MHDSRNYNFSFISYIRSIINLKLLICEDSAGSFPLQMYYKRTRVVKHLLSVLRSRADSKHHWLVGHLVSVLTMQLCHYHAKQLWSICKLMSVITFW